MKTTEYTYMPTAVTDEVKQHVRRIAKSHRRSMSQQAGELLELGLAEYERLTSVDQDVKAGRTQVDPSLAQSTE